MSKIAIAWLDGSWKFRLLRNHQTVFYNGSAVLHLPWQWMDALVSQVHTNICVVTLFLF